MRGFELYYVLYEKPYNVLLLYNNTVLQKPYQVY